MCVAAHEIGASSLTQLRTIVLTVLAFALLAPAAAADLSPLGVQGNHLMRDGKQFNFHGVSRDSLEWGDSNWNGCGGDGHFTDADFDHIAAWQVNAVRLPLSQANWLGRRCSSVNYPALVDAAIAKANARGMYAILDLHWTDVHGQASCDSGCGSGEQPMPDSDSVEFWRGVATRYANRPGVMFELYNEPHDVSWSCWLSGGCQVTASTGGSPWSGPPSYRAVGMQTLYDTVRATGAGNLVLVSGLDWAYDLSGVSAGYALSAQNLVYVTHVYVRWHSTTSDWDPHFGALAARYPVAATELGSTDCSSDRTQSLLQYLDAPGGRTANRISWTIWGWNAPGECSQPSVISDWSGTPLDSQGRLIHDTLARLAVPPAQVDQPAPQPAQPTPASQPAPPQAQAAGSHGSSPPAASGSHKRRARRPARAVKRRRGRGPRAPGRRRARPHR
jgi:aryl-phospho-beta-D-glucosidase BglC (GH1 family)